MSFTSDDVFDIMLRADDVFDIFPRHRVRLHVTGSEAYDHFQQDPQIYITVISIRTSAALGYVIL
jgi:hypothetical protein